MNPQQLSIVIPFYNEADRFPKEDYLTFLGQSNANLILVDDASTDGTPALLRALQLTYPDRIDVLTHAKNSGKSESIRKGILHGLEKNDSNAIGYLDADLATSLEEFESISSLIFEGKKFVFGSRILRIGSTIERRFRRFLVGRIIATLISKILDVKVYDTQCGCKVFHPDMARILFKDPFISRWLFDVELFSRAIHHYGKEDALAMMEEVPLKSWIDRGESKVRASYFFKMFLDLWRIRKYHLRGLKE